MPKGKQMSKSRHRQRLTPSELEIIFREGATDQEIEAAIRSPRYWSYVVRFPSGAVAAWGRGRSRQTCERNAVISAGTTAMELCFEDDSWALGRWRFVLWPPGNEIGGTTSHGCCGASAWLSQR
jgi:hypothetical protein